MDLLEHTHRFMPVGFNVLFVSKRTREFSVDHYDWKRISTAKPFGLIVNSFADKIIYKYYVGSSSNAKRLDQSDYVSEDDLDKMICMDMIDSDQLWMSGQLSERFILKHKSLWTSSTFKFQTMSEAFITKHMSDLDMDVIFEAQILSEEFVVKHIDKVKDRQIVYCAQKLSDQFYEKYCNRPLIVHSKTSDHLIKKYIDQLDTTSLLVEKKHTVDMLNFIVDNLKLNEQEWEIIWVLQNVSEEFILKHANHIKNPIHVLMSQDVSLKFKTTYFNSI